MQLRTKQSHSVGMTVFQPSVHMCELHDHTSKTLLINWKHSNTQGNSVITMRKTRVSFVDLASFLALQRVSNSPLKLMRTSWIFFSPYFCYFKRSFHLAKAAEQSSASTALSKRCMKWCEPQHCACTNTLLEGTFTCLSVPEAQSSGLLVAGIDVFPWKANLCDSWALPAFGS